MTSTTPNDLLNAALAYAAEGLYVHPLHPGTKDKPLDTWPKKATLDARAIKRWWTNVPDLNVAIATGPSALVVIDVDIKKGAGGEASWTALVAEHGAALVTTRSNVTPSGGHHHWFRHAIRNIRGSQNALGPGIDIRALGNYIVAPPSVTPIGSYAFPSAGAAPIIDLPPSLLKLLEPRAPLQQPPSPPEPVTRGDLQLALDCLARLGQDRCDTYEPWLHVGMVLHSLDPSKHGLAVWDEWSRGSSKYVAGEPARLWLGFKRDGGLSLGSLVQWAAEDDPGGKPARYHLTPFGNSDRFVRDHAGAALHNHTSGRWLYWNESYWRPDVDGEVRRLGRRTLLSIYNEVSSGRSKSAREALGRWASRSESEKSLREMLSLARDSLSLKTTHEALDTDLWLLNTPDGTIDLRTGKLKDADPTDRITRTTSCGPKGTSPGTWDRHIRYFLPDDGTRRWVQRELGRAMSGVHLAEILNIWYGAGANGKTTTAQAIQRVLKDYCRQAAPGILVASRYDRHPTALADLWGSRVVFSEEVREGSKLAETLMKQLTGGGVIKARFMHRDFFEFEPTWDITLIVNHRPAIITGGHATWRRLRLVPWEVVMPDAEQRPMVDVVAELVKDGPAVLRWLLAGLKDWLESPRWEPESIKVATQEYREAQNVLADFFTDLCELEPSYKVSKGELYEAYSAWCMTNGEDPISKRKIGRHFPRGVGEARGLDGIRMWTGIRVKGPSGMFSTREG